MADLSGLAYFTQGLTGGIKNTSDILNDWDKLKIAKQEAERKKQLEGLTIQQGLLKDLKDNPENVLSLMDDPAMHQAYLTPETAAGMKQLALRNLLLKQQAAHVISRAATNTLSKDTLLDNPEVVNRITDIKPLQESFQRADEQDLWNELVAKSAALTRAKGTSLSPADLFEMFNSTKNPGLAAQTWAKLNPGHTVGGFSTPEMRREMEKEYEVSTLINAVDQGGADPNYVMSRLTALKVNPDSLLNNQALVPILARNKAFMEGFRDFYQKANQGAGEILGGISPLGAGPILPKLSPAPSQSRPGILPSLPPMPATTNQPGFNLAPGVGAVQGATSVAPEIAGRLPGLGKQVFTNDDYRAAQKGKEATAVALGQESTAGGQAKIEHTQAETRLANVRAAYIGLQQEMEKQNKDINHIKTLAETIRSTVLTQEERKILQAQFAQYNAQLVANGQQPIDPDRLMQDVLGLVGQAVKTVQPGQKTVLPGRNGIPEAPVGRKRVWNRTTGQFEDMR